MKERVKVNSIFNEFDAYAHNQFTKFVQMSQQRYKWLKSGNSLDNILANQRQEYKDLSSGILENNFYLNNDIEKESKKLYRKVPQKLNQELFLIRKDIIEKTKDYTAKERKRRDRLASNGLKKRKKGKEIFLILIPSIDQYKMVEIVITI